MEAQIVAIWKPKGPTSHDIISALRKITGVRRIGHAGTLDPLAEGVLVVGIGRDATKTLSVNVAHEKEYLATVRLGATSTTDDAEGEKTEIEIKRNPSLEDIESLLPRFTGTIAQTPPPYSAIKLNGKKAYELARRGKEVALAPRKVIIKKIDIVSYRWPQLILKVLTGPGVYIRALARDIGEALGTGAYLETLERLRVGNFDKQKAMTIEKFTEWWKHKKALPQ